MIRKKIEIDKNKIFPQLFSFFVQLKFLLSFFKDACKIQEFNTIIFRHGLIYKIYLPFRENLSYKY